MIPEINLGISLFDTVRILAVMSAVITYVLAGANLIVSFKVLQNKPFTARVFFGTGAGFLFAHVLFVTIPFQGFVTLSIVDVVGRLGNTYLTYRGPLLLLLTLLMNIGYTIIFRIELARYRMRPVPILKEDAA